MVYSMARGSFSHASNAYICLWGEFERQHDEQHERTLQSRILPPLILMKTGDNLRASFSSCHSDKLSLNHWFNSKARQISHKKIEGWSREMDARFSLWPSRVLLSGPTISHISRTDVMDQWGRQVQYFQPMVSELTEGVGALWPPGFCHINGT